MDSHLDRFMVDLRKRIKQRGEASSSASEIDQISETIHLALKTSSATLDTASSKAAAAAPDTAATPDVAVHSVAVSAPLAVPQPSVSRKEAIAMELCKPTGAPGAPSALRLASIHTHDALWSSCASDGSIWYCHYLRRSIYPPLQQPS